MKGYFTVLVSRGGYERVSLKFQNMILKSGFDFILNNTSSGTSTSLINTCILSNGTTAPQFEDTGMSGDIVGTLGISNQYTTYSTPSGSTNNNFENKMFIHRHDFKTKATTFATISEIATAAVGADNSTVLFSKTLLKDSAGNPAQFSVAPGDDIEIRYTFVAARNKEVKSNFTISTSASASYEYWTSPMAGLRKELNSWSIGSYSESVSKAGCTWSIDFDTSKAESDKTFDIIFNLEYAEGSTAYGSFLTTTSGNRFNFYYKFFNTSYSTLVPAKLASELTNGRKIKIKQTFKIIDVSTLFGYSTYGNNPNLVVSGVARDLTKGGMMLDENTYNSITSYGTVIYKRFIKPFTPYPNSNIDHLLLCNNYVYNNYYWDNLMYGASSALPYLNTVDKLQIDKTVLSSDIDMTRLYINYSVLGAKVDGTSERLDAFVNRACIYTNQQTTGVADQYWYTVRLEFGIYGKGYWSSADTVAPGIKIYVNDVELTYNTNSYYNGWVLLSEGTELKSDYSNTLPLDGTEVIRIVGNGYDITFNNKPYDSYTYDGEYKSALHETIGAAVSLHSDFYGENNE